MALLAEEIVEEWLNRQGYFTIRGAKVVVHELDLLALRPTPDGGELRHVEVQASVNPIAYISRVPREVQKATGQGATSAKRRSAKELRDGVTEWCHKKFDLPRKVALRERLASGTWTKELVVHRSRYPEELDFIAERGVTVHRLSDIIDHLANGSGLIERASGAHLVELLLFGRTA